MQPLQVVIVAQVYLDELDQVQEVFLLVDDAGGVLIKQLDLSDQCLLEALETIEIRLEVLEVAQDLAQEF